MLSSSPKLFAANHVLHRLLPPRHPPSALGSLTNVSSRNSEHASGLAEAAVHPPRNTCRQTSCPDALDTERYSIIKDRRTHESDHQPVSGWPPSRDDVENFLRRPSGSAPGQCAIPHNPHNVRACRMGTGGADRDRTDDLRLAKPALSQLSYSPTIVCPRFNSMLPDSRTTRTTRTTID